MMRHIMGGLGLGFWLAGGLPLVQADDVRTLSGTTFHNVRTVRVEPDGVTWEYATGVVKVDFTDLPEKVRQTYHYDAGKAAAFKAVQTRERARAAAQVQQAQQEAAAHWVQRAVSAQAAVTLEADGKAGTFVYRRDRAFEALVQSMGEQMAAEKQAKERFHESDGTIWDRRLWYIPCLLTGGGYHDGHAFDPPAPNFGGGDSTSRSWSETLLREEIAALPRP